MLKEKKIFLIKLKQSSNAGKSRMGIQGLVLFVTDLNLISSAGGAYERCFELLPSLWWNISFPYKLDEKITFEISWDLTGVRKDLVLSTSKPIY